jgi:Fur family peroxide stress response transcriptional regulator
MSPAKIREELRFFEEACRRAGLKLTHQRLEIYRELARSSDHPSAEALHGRLRTRIPTLSLDTVYRTLATFNGYGLVQKVETAESQARYEVVHERHHHLICRRCHEIMDFCWPSLEGLPLPEEIGAWGEVDTRNVVIYGVCGKCRQKTSAADKKKG